MPNDLLTVKEVHNKYKISNRTLYYWISNKQIRTYKIGRKHFLSEADLFQISA